MEIQRMKKHMSKWAKTTILSSDFWFTVSFWTAEWADPEGLIFLLSHWWKCKDGSRHKDGGCSKLSFPSGDDRRSYTSNILFFSRHVTKGIHKHSYRGTVISHFEFSRRFHLSPSIKTMIGGNMYYGITELHFYPLWQWLREREGWEMTSSSSFTETQEFVYNNVIWMSTQILGL